MIEGELHRNSRSSLTHGSVLAVSSSCSLVPRCGLAAAPGPVQYDSLGTDPPTLEW